MLTSPVSPQSGTGWLSPPSRWFKAEGFFGKDVLCLNSLQSLWLRRHLLRRIVLLFPFPLCFWPFLRRKAAIQPATLLRSDDFEERMRGKVLMVTSDTVAGLSSPTHPGSLQDGADPGSETPAAREKGKLIHA